MDKAIAQIIERLDALRARGEELAREQHRWLQQLKEIAAQLEQAKQGLEQAVEDLPDKPMDQSGETLPG